MQLGPGPQGEELFHSMQPLLVSVLSDTTASPAARLHVSALCSMTTATHLTPEPASRLPYSEGEPHGWGTRLML